MKSALLVSASCLLAFGSVRGEESTSPVDPHRPTGRLEVSTQMVRRGAQPTLSWEIQYPKQATDIAEIGADDALTLKERSLVEVRIVGAAFQVGTIHTPIALQTRIGAGRWETLYHGPDHAVNPNEVLYSAVVEAGTRMDFSGRAQQLSGSWYSSRTTLGEGLAVTALTNGSGIPSLLSAYNQGNVANFLTPYLSAAETITVGPREILYLFELYSTDASSSYFDLQDLAVVVRFKDVP